MSSVKLSRRSANYSKAEIDCLLTYVEEHPDLINVRLGGQYESAEDIRQAWEEVAEKITMIGGYFGTRRQGQEVKRKWADLKSRVKAKAAALAIENNPTLPLSSTEERVLAIISHEFGEQTRRTLDEIIKPSTKLVPSVKVFSFHNESNSEGNQADSEYGDEEKSQTGNPDESGVLVEEIKQSSNEDKKRRISEAFSVERERKSLGLKRLKIVTEEEQLQELCNSQQEIINEVRSMKEVLKKCQHSIEKIALLKRAELRLKCAKYGVDFGDLFD